jgi:hypothetical protein
MAENRRPVRVLTHCYFPKQDKSANFLHFFVAVWLLLGLGWEMEADLTTST